MITKVIPVASGLCITAYCITGNLCERKHSQFENSKLINKKIFTNDKNFNVFMQKLKDLLENICE